MLAGGTVGQAGQVVAHGELVPRPSARSRPLTFQPPQRSIVGSATSTPPASARGLGLREHGVLVGHFGEIDLDSGRLFEEAGKTTSGRLRTCRPSREVDLSGRCRAPLGEMMAGAAERRFRPPVRARERATIQ